MLEYMNGWCPYELKDLNDAEKRAEICGVSKDEVRADVTSWVMIKNRINVFCKAMDIYLVMSC